MKTISLIGGKSVKTCPNCGRKFFFRKPENLQDLYGDLFDDYNQLCPECKPQIDNTPYIAEAINMDRIRLLEAC